MKVTRLFLPALILTLATSALAHERTWAPWKIEPTVFFRTEFVSGGAGVGFYGGDRHSPAQLVLVPDVSMLNVDVEWRKLRFGVSAMEVFLPGLSVMPMRAGFTIIDRPHNYAGRLFGKTPEVYAQFKAHWAVWFDPPPYVHGGCIEVVAAIDRYGLGLSASAGVISYWSSYSAGEAGQFSLLPYVGIRLRLGTLCAGF